ncbi:hypothetical protein EJ04DRAFT_128374 [Polyplosphaeria fusca]|uniref:Uncharacterized protein n=1 Tax=Polyplosphaeria fusca TaxID=682080 RepID=A0A9P4UWH2_9PLEO|nr:hypothetical protein EJ04DRAFT_128374 [Polyplosphaeria fusca]
MAPPLPASSPEATTASFALASIVQRMPAPTADDWIPSTAGEDWHASFASLASAMATVTNTAPAGSNTTFSNTVGNPGLSGGVIAGIVVAILVVFSVSVLGVFFFWRYRLSVRLQVERRLPTYEEVLENDREQGHPPPIPRHPVEMPAEVPPDWLSKRAAAQRAMKNRLLEDITQPGESSRINVIPVNVESSTASAKQRENEPPSFINPHAVEYEPNIMFAHLRGDQHEYKVILPEDDIAPVEPTSYSPVNDTSRFQPRSSPERYPCYGSPDSGWQSEQLYSASGSAAATASRSESRPLLSESHSDVIESRRNDATSSDIDHAQNVPGSSNNSSRNDSTPPSTVSSNPTPHWRSKYWFQKRFVTFETIHLSRLTVLHG